MDLSRREFVVVSAAAAVAGCQAGGSGPSTVREAVVDAGPQSDYAADGVYEQFRDRGFFLIRREKELIALSSICTHRTCVVHARPDGSFACPCHGSRFDAQGKVTKGPATRDLPVLPIVVNSSGHVVIENFKPT